MADASEDINEDVLGVIGLIFLVVVGYWFFSEDDIEDVAQYALESAFDGDEDAIAELDANYIDWGGRFNMWLADENIDLASVFVGSAVLNYDIANNAEHVVRRFERRAEDHDGWDDVEIIAYGSKELPLPEQSFWEWIVSFFADGPYEPIVDEAGAAVAKVTYDDDAVEFYLLTLSHIDESEFTREGWAIKSWSLIKAFAADRDNDDEINKLEEKLIEKYEKAFDD